MKRWGAVALLVLLSGCASDYTSNAGKSLQLLKLAVHRGHVEPTASSVAAKPFYQLQAISPDGEAILILGGVEGDVQAWYGRNGEAIFLDHGEVVRTLGLRQNVDHVRWSSDDPFRTGLQRLDRELATTRTVDWSPGYRYGIAEHVRLTPVRIENVDILGTMHALQRIDEVVNADGSGFVAHNTYWVDPADGFVWRSHQVVAPGMPLDLVELRPLKDGSP